jgi:hypothetical protein
MTPSQASRGRSECCNSDGIVNDTFTFSTQSAQPNTTAKMVYLDTMEEWQRQATQLFQARPATVRKSTNPPPTICTWLTDCLLACTGSHHNQIQHSQP